MLSRTLQWTYSRWFAWLVLWPTLWVGTIVFRFTGRTPWLAYWSMRRLYCITRGRSNHWLVRRLAVPAHRPSGFLQGVLAELGPSRWETVLGSLRRDGYAVIGPALSSAQIESLVAFARATPARLMPRPSAAHPEQAFGSGPPQAIKYDLLESRLIEHPVVQQLLTDASLRELARRYLNCEPVNDLVAMWWSTAFSGQASSEVAQLYHFDMDRPQFLKLFFYLTDVTPETGPHCYIRGSHRTRPDALWRDGRHDDQAVLSLYGEDAEVKICAPSGTLIAVDTSGFHKGKPLMRGHRLMLQIEYTSTLFGAPYTRPTLPDTAFWRAQVADAPAFFARFALR